MEMEGAYLDYENKLLQNQSKIIESEQREKAGCSATGVPA